MHINRTGKVEVSIVSSMPHRLIVPSVAINVNGTTAMQSNAIARCGTNQSNSTEVTAADSGMKSC